MSKKLIYMYQVGRQAGRCIVLRIYIHIYVYMHVVGKGESMNNQVNAKMFVIVSPMIWVPNQLVGAPAGTDVTIDCHTEAYPRAISYWVYDNVMLLPTKKYGTDTTENSYRADMKLTIRNLQPGDFGNYRCISKNSLGETEGSIRLYGKFFTFILHVPHLFI